MTGPPNSIISNIPRASGADEALHLVPTWPPSIEKSIEFVKEDELVEVTPQSIGLRRWLLEGNTWPKNRVKGE